VPTVNDREVEFVSKHLRNYEYNPVCGFLADQSWLGPDLSADCLRFRRGVFPVQVWFPALIGCAAPGLPGSPGAGGLAELQELTLRAIGVAPTPEPDKPHKTPWTRRA
jgi:hypothetical protein